MAASGYTPILIYASGTATNVPLAANLTSGASGAELALNYADGKLYYKDDAGVVQLIASKAAAAGVTSFSAGTTGFTPSTGTNGAVTLAGILKVANGGTGLSSLTANYLPYGNGTGAMNSSSALQFDGTTFRIGANAPLGGTTNPILIVTGTANNYIQQYIYNANTGTSASADFVAYANNSTDAHGWADMGFTNANYADAVYTVTGPNEAYVFGSAPSGSGATGNLVFATDSTGTANAFQWYVGGFTQAKSAWKAQLTSSFFQVAIPIKFQDGSTQSSAGVSTGKSIAMAMIFGG